jgi:plastocyanin
MEKKINIVALIFRLMLISFVVIMTGCTKSDNSISSYNTGGSSPAPGTNEVLIQGMAFNPASKTIAIGTTITWTNKDSYAHTVTSGIPNSPDGLFNSGNLNNGGIFSFKFTATGTFNYYCMIHGAMMTAKIIVQ